MAWLFSSHILFVWTCSLLFVILFRSAFTDAKILSKYSCYWLTWIFWIRELVFSIGVENTTFVFRFENCFSFQLFCGVLLCSQRISTLSIGSRASQFLCLAFGADFGSVGKKFRKKILRLPFTLQSPFLSFCTKGSYELVLSPYQSLGGPTSHLLKRGFPIRHASMTPPF